MDTRLRLTGGPEAALNEAEVGPHERLRRLLDAFDAEQKWPEQVVLDSLDGNPDLPRGARAGMRTKAHRRSAFGGWRGLGRFWVIVAAVLGCGAALLQALGPPETRRVATTSGPESAGAIETVSRPFPPQKSSSERRPDSAAAIINGRYATDKPPLSHFSPTPLAPRDVGAAMPPVAGRVVDDPAMPPPSVPPPSMPPPSVPPPSVPPPAPLASPPGPASPPSAIAPPSAIVPPAPPTAATVTPPPSTMPQTQQSATFGPSATRSGGAADAAPVPETQPAASAPPSPAVDSEVAEPGLFIYYTIGSLLAEKNAQSLAGQIGNAASKVDVQAQADVPKVAVIRFSEERNHALARTISRSLTAFGYPWKIENITSPTHPGANTVEVWVPAR